jgi:hypothetical protein
MCPWSGYAPATIAFCERRLCAWVVEPSNAWSNLAYVLVGAWILWRRRARPGSALSAVGIAAVLLGLGSFAFHATGVRAFEVVDVAGMYLISGLALAFGLQRLRGWSDAVAMGFLVASVVASSLLMVALGNDGIVVFGVQSLAVLWLELRLRTRTPDGVGRWLLAAVGVLGVGLVIWVLDLRGPLCDPDNHFVTGHAVWHALTALSLLCFFNFHEGLRQPPHERTFGR